MPDGSGFAAATVGVPTLRVKGLVRRFGPVTALDGLNFTVERGEIRAIIGRSGAGKSTLIRCLNGLERPDAGVVALEGRDIARLPERELPPVRRQIGMIFQHFNLMAARTVAGNVALPLKIAGVPRRERAERVAELLDMVGLSGKAEAYPAQLSGGQKQRVGIARALATRPALLLCDEATSALDPETTDTVLALLRDINRSLGLTIVLITHEMRVVRAIADQVIVLEAGRVVEEGPVERIFAAPREALTRRLLAGLDQPHGAAAPWPAEFGRSVIRVRVHRDQVGAVLDDLARAGIRPSFLSGARDSADRNSVAVFLSVPDAVAGAAASLLQERCYVEQVEQVSDVAGRS